MLSIHPNPMKKQFFQPTLAITWNHKTRKKTHAFKTHVQKNPNYVKKKYIKLNYNQKHRIIHINVIN
jgi:hypothetical protein